MATFYGLVNWLGALVWGIGVGVSSSAAIEKEDPLLQAMRLNAGIARGVDLKSTASGSGYANPPTLRVL